MNSSHFELVGIFHKVFDHPLRTKLHSNIFEDNKLIRFRYDLINEELNEFRVAFLGNDIVEMADALCDMAYVIHGAGHCIGHELDPSKNKPTRILGGLDNIEDKIDQHQDNSISKKELYDCFITKIIGIIDVKMKIFAEQIIKKDINIVIECLDQICFLVYYLANKISLDFDKMFREVHRSNMTKACRDESEAIDSANVYLENKLYEDPSYRKMDGYYIVYDMATGKILKNHKWEKPKIRELIPISHIYFQKF
jgi:predicted HAD superfamily Cof-like phosphohydrolase